MKTFINAFNLKKTRFLFLNTPENAEGVSSTPKDSKDLTPEDTKRLDKEQQKRIYNETIHDALDAIGNPEKEFPKEFATVPASVLLQQSTENLHTLFVKDGVVEFHGNMNARRRIGAGDLFDVSQKFIKINGVVGQRAIDSKFNKNKVGYIGKNGKYLAILGTERISLDVSEDEEKGFEPFEFSFTFTKPDGTILTGESAYKAQFLAETQQQEERKEEAETEMKDALKGKAENFSSTELFYNYSKIAAETLENKYGIPAEVTMAMTALESGNGQSGLSVNHKNYFGRIALPGESSAEMTTNEDWGKGLVSEKRGFKTYNSVQESFIDFGELMMTKRYKGIFEAYKNRNTYTIPSEYAGAKTSDRNTNTEMTRELKEPADVLWAIVASGYATLSTNKYIASAEIALKALSNEKESLYV